MILLYWWRNRQTLPCGEGVVTWPGSRWDVVTPKLLQNVLSEAKKGHIATWVFDMRNCTFIQYFVPWPPGLRTSS